MNSSAFNLKVNQETSALVQVLSGNFRHSCACVNYGLPLILRVSFRYIHYRNEKDVEKLYSTPNSLTFLSICSCYHFVYTVNIEISNNIFHFFRLCLIYSSYLTFRKVT